MTTRNEAAERLIENAWRYGLVNVSSQVDAALAEERRLTVERIRERLNEFRWDHNAAPTAALKTVTAILDDLASPDLAGDSKP